MIMTLTDYVVSDRRSVKQTMRYFFVSGVLKFERIQPKYPVLNTSLSMIQLLKTYLGSLMGMCHGEGISEILSVKYYQ